MTIVEGLMLVALVVYLGTAAFILVISAFNDDTPLTFSIFDLYHETKMNWFGCLLAWIGIVIINPFWWLVYKPLCYIGLFFKWLFTVGRK